LLISKIFHSSSSCLLVKASRLKYVYTPLGCYSRVSSPQKELLHQKQAKIEKKYKEKARKGLKRNKTSQKEFYFGKNYKQQGKTS